MRSTARWRTGEVRVSWEAIAVAAVLVGDAACHLYWSTGAVWPATSAREVSLAVLAFVVPFTPAILLPLAAILLTAAALVLARSAFGARGRFGWLRQLAVIGLTAGFLIRGVLGIVWIGGIGTAAGSTFFWLNILLYTPLCLALAALGARIAFRDVPRRRILTELRLSLVEDFLHGR